MDTKTGTPINKYPPIHDDTMKAWQEAERGTNAKQAHITGGGQVPPASAMPPGIYHQTGVFEMGCDSGGTPIVAEAHADEFCEQLQQERPNMRLRFDEWRLIHAGVKAAILYGVAWERTSYQDVPDTSADKMWAKVGRDVFDELEKSLAGETSVIDFVKRMHSEFLDRVALESHQGVAMHTVAIDLLQRVLNLKGQNDPLGPLGSLRRDIEEFLSRR